MRWCDERYVKLYSRDTPTWLAMRWEARALLPLLLRKLDNAGLMELGPLARNGVARMVDLPWEVVGPGLDDLERLGVIAWRGNTLEAPNFIEAQEARKTDAQRKRDQRSRDRDHARAQAIETIGVGCHTESHGVTRSHPPSPSPSPSSSSRKDLSTEVDVSGESAALLEAWERHCPRLPQWRRPVAPKRREKLKAALKRRPLAEWEEVFRRLSGLPFANGSNDRQWKADLDWALRPEGRDKPEPATKILEGGFGGSQPRKQNFLNLSEAL